MTHTAITLQKFDYSPDLVDDTLLEISGRSAGIIGWVLDQLKLGTQSSITIRRGEVDFKFSGLGGITHVVCPFDAIRCAEAGVSKPFWQLVVGVLLALGALTMFGREFLYGLIGLVVGIALVVSYFLTKKIYITFSTSGIGASRGLAFTSTPLEGKRIELEDILEVIAGINHHLVMMHTHGSVPPPKLKRATETSGILGESTGTSSERSVPNRTTTTTGSQKVIPTKSTSSDPQIGSTTIETLKLSAESPILDPNDAADKNFREGFKLYQQKQYDDAIKLLDKAILLNPDHANSYGCRAKCYQLLGDEDQYQKDIAVFRKINKK